MSMPVIVLVAALAAGTQGQPPSALPETMLNISGEASVVRYVPDALDRAVHVARRLDLIAGDLRRRLNGPSPLAAAVLGRREWEASGQPRPYGLPNRIGTTTVLTAVPAAGDGGTVALWKRWLGTELPAIQGQPLVGTREEVASLLLADIFLQREACELVVVQTLLVGRESWITGLMTHLALLTLFDRYEPSRMVQVETVFLRLRRQIPLLLELGAGQPMPTERFLLREAHFFEGAAQIYRQGGPKALTRLNKQAKKLGGPLTREALVAEYPSVQAWLAGLPEAAEIR
ncbi:MAG: hypothetical protein R3190_07885 [Thermoanaerobaculia bacterium]|nr:hypothetical protein [Thermoanaerobaculia bacterium]